jgi:hypothetical protein
MGRFRVFVTTAAFVAGTATAGFTSLTAGLQVGAPPTATSMAPIPLASHPQGQAMMAEAVRKAALLDINFQFLDKTYENDTYVRDPLGNKQRVACWRFRGTSGFRFKVDHPKYSLTGQGLTIDQNISRITADALTVKVQVGPCVDVAAGLGLRLSNVRVVYKAKPMIRMEANRCVTSWSTQTDELNISIGDLNITGVQNNLDTLAKDAAREAVNATFDTYFGSVLSRELVKASVSFCGGK